MKKTTGYTCPSVFLTGTGKDFDEQAANRNFIRAEDLIPRPLGRMRGIKSRLQYL
jgi:hypothetical protein